MSHREIIVCAPSHFKPVLTRHGRLAYPVYSDGSQAYYEGWGPTRFPAPSIFRYEAFATLILELAHS